MPITSKKKPVLVLDLPKDVPNFVLKARTFALNVTGNPMSFSTLVPTGVIVGTEIDTLVATETALENRTGAIGPRNDALDIAWASITNWGSMVQVLARTLTSYSAQVNLIHLFGGRVKVNGKFVRAPFTLTNPTAGVVEMVKARIANTVNEFQVSFDMGVTWDGEDLPATKLNTVTMGGFIVGAKIMIKTRSNLGLVKGVWLIESIIITK